MEVFMSYYLSNECLYRHSCLCDELVTILRTTEAVRFAARRAFDLPPDMNSI